MAVNYFCIVILGRCAKSKIEPSFVLRKEADLLPSAQGTRKRLNLEMKHATSV